MSPVGSAFIHKWPPQSRISPCRTPRSTPGLSDADLDGVRSRGLLSAVRSETSGAQSTAHFRDRDQHVIAWTDVGVFRDELGTDDDRGKFNQQPPTERHTLTSVARDVDEDSLDTLRLDIDVDRGRGLRQDEFDVVSGHPLEHGLQVAQHPVHVDRFEGGRLLLAVHGELSQEPGRARHFMKQPFTFMPQGRVAVDCGQPLLGILTDVPEHVVAGRQRPPLRVAPRLPSVGPGEVFLPRREDW